MARGRSLSEEQIARVRRLRLIDKLTLREVVSLTGFGMTAVLRHTKPGYAEQQNRNLRLYKRRKRLGLVTSDDRFARRAGWRPLYDPIRDGRVELDNTARLMGDPQPNRRAIVAAHKDDFTHT